MVSSKPNNLRNQVHFSFKEIEHDVAVVRPGDTISEFETLNELDRCSAALARFAFYGNYLVDLNRGYYREQFLNQEFSAEDHERMRKQSSNGRVVYRPWNFQMKMPSDIMAPKGFHGKFSNISATLLGPVNNENEAVKRPFNILLSANLNSTGRGVIGRSSKLMSGTEPMRMTDSGHLNRSVDYIELSDDDANIAAKLLISDSSDIAHLLASDNLRRAILSGLPSLGKR